MKSFYYVQMAMSGGVYRDAQFTYRTLTELQQALDFELWTDLREQEATFLFAYDDLPLMAYIGGRKKQEINLLPFITVRGANGVAFTLHENGASHNFTYTKDKAVLKGTDVVADEEFMSSAVVYIDWGAVPVPQLEEPVLGEGEKAEYEEEDRGQTYRESFEYGFYDAEADDGCDAEFRQQMDEALAIDPDWLRVNGGAVSLLAEGMRASGDYSGMPALADALQEAGCENELFLAHCRAPAGVHARGSWLVERLRRPVPDAEEEDGEE